MAAKQLQSSESAEVRELEVVQIGEKNKGWQYIGFGLYGNITPLREWARLSDGVVWGTP